VHGARVKELRLERVGTFRCLKQWPLNAKARQYLKSKRRVKALPHQVSRCRTARRMFLMLATFPLDFFCQGIWHQLKGSKIYKFSWSSVVWQKVMHAITSFIYWSLLCWIFLVPLGLSLLKWVLVWDVTWLASDLSWHIPPMRCPDFKPSCIEWYLRAFWISLKSFYGTCAEVPDFSSGQNWTLGKNLKTGRPFLLRTPKSYWSI